MKLSDMVELAKAGFKPADIFKLLEYVENSPAVQEATPDITPDKVPENTPVEVEQPAPKEEKGPTAEEIMNKVFE